MTALTFAEPAVSALLPLGSLVKVNTAPYLYALLHQVLSIGLGVGIASTVGILSFTKNWSLKPLILIPLIPSLLLAAYMVWVKPELTPTIGLIWDCGAVTTGPVTVPIILALGIGTSKSKKRNTSDGNNLGGLGLVTLASLFPILVVEMFAIALASVLSEEQIIEEAAASKEKRVSPFDTSPLSEFMFGFRAVIPLITFLLLTLKFVIKEGFPNTTVTEVVGNDGCTSANAYGSKRNVSFVVSSPFREQKKKNVPPD